MIVYYSGTGNSRYVGEMLADFLGDETVNAAELIKEGKPCGLHSEKPWVFISPVYVSAPPLIFLDLIKKLSLSGCNDAWFVMTCAGGMGASPDYCERAALGKGLHYMGTAQIIMPQNYLVFFKTNDSAKSEAIIEEAKPGIRALAAKISAGERFAAPNVKWWEKASTKMILSPYYRFFITAKDFKAGSGCIGCGKCARVCPLNNILLKDSRPIWGENCTHCMACINMCPKQAIEYGTKSIGKPRYAAPKYKPE